MLLKSMKYRVDRRTHDLQGVISRKIYEGFEHNTKPLDKGNECVISKHRVILTDFQEFKTQQEAKSDSRDYGKWI
eukprot:g7903.t1